MTTATAIAPVISTTEANTPPAHGDYWPGQGGRYICTLLASLGLPSRHLIASDAEAQDLAFGPYLDVLGACSQLDGPGNTAALLAAGQEHPAAAWAAAYTADGHTDFHLPSRNDLLMAYIYAPQHFSKDVWYLSSTQSSRNVAFVQDFEGGLSYWSLKGSERRVRAFRWIPLNP
jgi:WD40 repeat protein